MKVPGTPRQGRNTPRKRQIKWSMALSIGSTARVLSAQQAYSITSRNDKSAEDDAYSSVRNVAKTGGDLFTRDIDAVLDEVAKVESGESGDRKQLAKLLNSVADNSQAGVYSNPLVANAMSWMSPPGAMLDMYV